MASLSAYLIESPYEWTKEVKDGQATDIKIERMNSKNMKVYTINFRWKAKRHKEVEEKEARR